MTTESTISLDKYRRLRELKSDQMWQLLNQVFDRLGIPGNMRHELMRMDVESYLEWGMGLRIASRDILELAVQYTQLYRALRAASGGDELGIRRWLTSRHAHPDVFKNRSPLDTILEDGPGAIARITATLRRR